MGRLWFCSFSDFLSVLTQQIGLCDWRYDPCFYLFLAVRIVACLGIFCIHGPIISTLGLTNVDLCDFYSSADLFDIQSPGLHVGFILLSTHSTLLHLMISPRTVILYMGLKPTCQTGYGKLLQSYSLLFMFANACTFFFFTKEVQVSFPNRNTFLFYFLCISMITIISFVINMPKSLITVFIQFVMFLLLAVSLLRRLTVMGNPTFNNCR